MIVILEVGEIMQKGDEWYDNASGQGGGEKGWHPVVVMVGLPVTEGMIVRRPTKRAADVADDRPYCSVCNGYHYPVPKEGHFKPQRG